MLRCINWSRATSCSLIFASILAALGGCVFLGVYPERVRYIQYPVKTGDTLYDIGRRFNVSVEELQDINEKSNPKNLTVGEIIDVPYRGQSIAKGELDAGSKKTTPNRYATKASSSALRSVSISAARKYIGRLSWPVPGADLNSSFGWRWFNFHEGIDIAAPEGTPIIAAQSGTVVYSGNGIRGYGNIVIIRSEGLLTVYAHCYRIYASRGDSVTRGERIALVGQTGHATGPHLHFETRIKDSEGKNAAVDPMVFFNS